MADPATQAVEPAESAERMRSLLANSAVALAVANAVSVILQAAASERRTRTAAA
jgi:hypothetical protein